MNNTVVTPTPNPYDFDPTKVIEFIAGAIAFVTAFWKLVDAYFKSKRSEKEEFIKSVVAAAMDSSLSSIKQDVHELKQFRERDMKHFNDTVIQIYAEVRKP